MSEDRSTPEQARCEHAFVFLRQDVDHISYAARVWSDVFFCSKCLHYRKVKVRDSRDER
jgi:hypothetical protein